MEQYIQKSALVAEIEKKYNQEVQWINRQGYTEYHKGLRDSYADTLSFIDTLEVKEVDLEKEIDDAFLENKCNITDNVSLREFERIAKHFFELGLNAAQKGEQTEKGAVVGLSSPEPLNLPHR